MTPEPVERHVTHDNAAEILADLKARGGRFREIETIWVHRNTGEGGKAAGWACPCAGDSSGSRRLLARTLAAHDQETDHVFRWLWVAGHKTSSWKVPPSAVTLPDEHPLHVGRTLAPLITNCPRCRRPFFFFPCFFPNIEGMSGKKIEDGGPRIVITPNVVNVLEGHPGAYDRRVSK